MLGGILWAANVNALGGAIRVGNRRRARAALPRTLATGPATLDLLTLAALDAVADTPWSFNTPLHEWAWNPARVDVPLEWVYRHPVLPLTDLFWYTRAPVLDLDEAPLAVVVTRVADVQRPTGIPVRWARATTDVPSGKLDCNPLDQVVETVIGKVTCQSYVRLSPLKSAEATDLS
jgi:hypothetical protein